MEYKITFANIIAFKPPLSPKKTGTPSMAKVVPVVLSQIRKRNQIN